MMKKCKIHELVNERGWITWKKGNHKCYMLEILSHEVSG